jgi:RNA polymerase sigma-70 factor (ECF subfamily)
MVAAAPTPAPSALAPLADTEDRDLVRRHCAGDADAFAELFRRHKDRMWAVALRITRDPELAADCVQDGFISAYRRADSFRGDSAVTTWLHRIVVNACLDRLRRRRPQSQLPEHDLADRRDEHARTELRLDLEEALGRLPTGQRAALVLVDMHAVPVSEAAVILGVAEGTIKSRCARGRAALAAQLGLRSQD